MSKPLVLLPDATEPLVLVPGMMCDARIFGPQIKALGRTRALHLPPVGNHDNIEAIATDILAGAPAKFALAGFSMGGIIAMEIARQAPDRVSRLALMGTNALAETPSVAAAREPQIAKVLAGRLPDVMREEMMPNYLASENSSAEIEPIILDMALDLGEGVFLRQSRALQKRPNLQASLRKLAVPALVICGEHDKLCPVKRHEIMAELIPDATLVIVANAGHLLTLEQPDAVIVAMEKWLAR